MPLYVPVPWATPGAIGSTTPSTGAFTTLSASGAISANGGQIAFPASQSASADANTLDDYEEGTWTPVLTFETAGDLSVAYSAQVGWYTKIGRFVSAGYSINTSSFTHSTAADDLRITGLPFTSANVSGQTAVGPLTWSGITKAGYTDIAGRVQANTALISFLASASGSGSSAVSAANVPTGGTVVLNGAVNYIV